MKEKVKRAPESPGVYIFKSSGVPIYIGKAKNLKKRLFQHVNAKSGKSVFIVQEADDLEWIITKNEREALLLEANLIHHHKPKYNTLLKSAEVYPYIRISNGKFPYVEIVRRKGGSGEYYGPFTNVKFTRELLDALQRFLKFRTCKKNLDRIKKPCMDYYIGRCVGPCIDGNVSEEGYENLLNDLRSFLRGDVEEFVKKIKETMKRHAEMLDFENAARYRDILLKMESMLQEQGVSLPDRRNIDVVVGKNGMFVVLRIRGGFLLGKLSYEMESATMREFVERFYALEGEIPDRVVSKDSINTGLVNVSLPEDDAEDRLVEIALENLEEELRSKGLRKDMLKWLAEFMGLEKVRKIEGIDISHLQGRGTVASVVVFEDGKPVKEEYRRYRINLPKPDDYRSIKEVVKRRYSKHDVPDLLFVDGGIGQVKAAIHGLKLAGKSCAVVGIAKSEERVVKVDGEYRLPLDSPIVRVLATVRDEAHRFAVEGNRKIRMRESLKSVLRKIEGVGPKRMRNLVKNFSSYEDLKRASLEEIAKVVGSRKIARRIKDFL